MVRSKREADRRQSRRKRTVCSDSACNSGNCRRDPRMASLVETSKLCPDPPAFSLIPNSKMS
ncbi:hypothetical protein HUJ04_012277, partial [Dendroctonus ponderosae]